jgi:hypothetical protein
MASRLTSRELDFEETISSAIRQDITTIIPNNDKCRNKFTNLHCNNFLLNVLVILPGSSSDLQFWSAAS